MKKIVKILALVLVCVMMVGIFAACDNNKGNQSNAGNGSQGAGSGSQGTTPPKGDPYEVVIKYCYWWTQPTDEGTKGVEDAISKYVQDLGYNYTLKIEWASLFEYDTQVDMALAGGEKMDIIFGGFDCSSKVDNGYLIAIDDYLGNELADAVELLGDWMICGKLNGSTYIIPCYRTQCVTYCYNYIKECVDTIGYDTSKVENFYDIEDLFAALKAQYPTQRMDVDGSRYAAIIAELTKTATVGTYGATVGDDTTIVNYFETDAWKDAIDYSYRFRTLGYTNPDGSEASALTSEGPLVDTQIGIIIGFGASEAAQAEMYTERMDGIECGSIEVVVSNLTTASMGWGVAYTTKNASAAATLINLMWTDEFVLNTMMYGLEGRDYVRDENGVMSYPEGLDENSVPYQMALNSGVFGNMFGMYQGSEQGIEDLNYNRELIDNAWAVPLFGFTPAAGDIATAIASVSNVYNQYYNTLVYGDFEPTEMNATFLDALKTAGIDTVIAEYNAQAQAWLATK